MNRASRLAAAINSQANPFFQVKASLFHSTPVLERKKRYNWHYRANSFWSSPKKYNQHAKRSRKSMLRNVNAFAEHILQSWGSVHHEYDQPSSRQHSWFRPNFTGDGSKKGKSKAGRRPYEFCDTDDDIEFESIFRSAWNRSTSYSFFVDDDEPEFRSSFGHSSFHRKYSGRRYQYDEEYERSSVSGEPARDSSSDRLALGLTASGPLNVEDVRNAYRACALKWHPDRHQGSSKVAAEEKFKVCSAAYQSLCNKLAVS